jgi:hypothetical protein
MTREFEVVYRDEDHRYWLRSQGEQVDIPSVTQIIGAVTPKDALAWWGMRVGFAGAVEMMRHVGWADIANANEPAEIIRPKLIPPARQHFTKADRRRQKPRSLVEAWVVDAKRDTNRIVDEAADRGTDVHTALEAFAAGEVLSPREFPPERRGYIAGLNAWFVEQEPEVEEAEVLVGSWEHRFAGRYDANVRYPDGARVLTDLKTSSGVYVSHLLQLALYRVGYLELGLGPDFDRLEVLHVTEDGLYRLVPSRFTAPTVTAMVAFYHALQRDTALHEGLPGLMLDTDRRKR